MRRWLPAIALGALIAVGALALLWLVQPSAEPTAAARADALAAELRCPDCQGLAVADSPTSAAREIRRQIDELVATGASDDEVRAHFIARYGEWILLAPSSPLPWLVPFVVVAAGVGVVEAKAGGDADAGEDGGRGGPATPRDARARLRRGG